MIKNYETKDIKNNGGGKMSKKTIRLNAPLRSYAAGTELRIEVDEHGTPLDRYWRDRFKDAKKDNCVEFVSMKSAPKSSTKEVRKDVN